MRTPVFLLSLLLGAAEIQAAGFSIAAWNIHKGKRWTKIERALTFSALANTDVLALQEVITEGGSEQPRKIEEKWKGTISFAGRDAIASRLPVSEAGEVVVNKQSGRRAAWSDILVGEHKIRIYSLHLTYKEDWSPFIQEIRDQEMAAVLQHAETFEGPIVVAGDFNTVGYFVCCHRDAPLLGRLRRAGFSDALALRGIECPTQRLVGTVDWIFVKGLRVREARCGDFSGSDHRWISTQLELP